MIPGANGTCHCRTAASAARPAPRRRAVTTLCDPSAPGSLGPVPGTRRDWSTRGISTATSQGPDGDLLAEARNGGPSPGASQGHQDCHLQLARGGGATSGLSAHLEPEETPGRQSSGTPNVPSEALTPTLGKVERGWRRCPIPCPRLLCS